MGHILSPAGKIKEVNARSAPLFIWSSAEDRKIVHPTRRVGLSILITLVKKLPPRRA